MPNRPKIAKLFSFLTAICLIALGGCGAAATPAATDAETAADAAADLTASADDTVDIAADVAADASPKDAKKNDVPLPTCASRAGGYQIDGQCSNGGKPVPYACMLVKDCELTWVADYRTWSGPLTGVDFKLVGADGADTITGKFNDADTGSYQYQGGNLTCDEEMTRVDATVADSLCCDPVAQLCGKDSACVIVAEPNGSQDITTTGCVGLAAAATVEGGVCTIMNHGSNCQIGLQCANFTGSKDKSAFRCAKLCTKATECPASANCVVVATAPRAGVCEQNCSPFAELASPATCTDGATCVPRLTADAQAIRVIAGACVTAGDAELEASCTYSTDCKSNLVCADKKCSPMCDSKHPCANGTCTDFGAKLNDTAPVGWGYCK